MDKRKPHAVYNHGDSFRYHMIFDTKINQDILDNMKRNIPLNRLGLSEDIASLVCYLSSDISSYITGQVINIDGGMTIN